MNFSPNDGALATTVATTIKGMEQTTIITVGIGSSVNIGGLASGAQYQFSINNYTQLNQLTSALTYDLCSGDCLYSRHNFSV